MSNTRFAAPIFALLSLFLGGCAGYHSVPPAGYSAVMQPQDAALEQVYRVVFDQDGNIYPPSPNDLNLDAPPQPPNRNRAFVLPSFYERRNQSYDAAAITRWHAAAISRQLEAAGTNRIVFLIKGFNNSYRGSRTEFEFVRATIRRLGRDGPYLYVEVYWDSLYAGARSFPFPGSFWFESLTYSNLAGQVGLRRLIDALPDGLDLTFLTHSRGAAVAISALVDPVYDPGIRVPPTQPLPSGSVARSTLIAFAPAIGNGHVEQPDLARRLHRFYVGFNPRDYATRKLVGIPGRLGDTRLNADDAYYRRIESELNRGGANVMQREILSQSFVHDWEAYFANDRGARCLLWAGRLIASRPDSCAVTR